MVGVAAAQVVGTKPGGVEALAQKVEFKETYRSCVDPAPEPKAPKANLEPLDPSCQASLLSALWRDSRKLNLIWTFAFSDQPPSPVEQVRKVQELCEKETGLCGIPFKAKLDSCQTPRRAEPVDEGLAAARAETPETGSSSDREDTSDQCSEAWDAIWSGSGFFWHPGAARQLALSWPQRLQATRP